jgi:hypothetical protein
MAGCVTPTCYIVCILTTEFWTDRCVLAAVIGMATVVWYSLGGHISEEEIEHEVREQLAAKERRGRFFGLKRKP